MSYQLVRKYILESEEDPSCDIILEPWRDGDGRGDDLQLSYRSTPSYAFVLDREGMRLLAETILQYLEDIEDGP